MNQTLQRVLRRLSAVTRPLAMRSAGNAGSRTAVVRHTGRRTGRVYRTPVTVARHDDCFVIALPYGDRTDWAKNVVHAGSAAITADGHTYEVDRPEVIPIAEAAGYFAERDRRMLKQFKVDKALRLHTHVTELPQD